MNVDDYDGFYFLPPDEEDLIGEDLKIVYFHKDKKLDSEVPQKTDNNGYWFHVVMFKEDKDGSPVFDETFEAIFLDPIEYIKGLIGCNLYGVFLKKTSTSKQWTEKYIKEIMTKLA